MSFFLFVYEIHVSLELLNRFAPNSHGRRLVAHSNEFEVQGQRPRSPGTQNGIFGPFGGQHAVYVW